MPIRTHRYAVGPARSYRKTWRQGVRDVSALETLVNNSNYTGQHFATSASASQSRVKPRSPLAAQNQSMALPLDVRPKKKRGGSRNKRYSNRTNMLLHNALYGTPFQLYGDGHERYVSDPVIKSRMRPSRQQKYKLEQHWVDREQGKYRRRGREYLTFIAIFVI